VAFGLQPLEAYGLFGQMPWELASAPVAESAVPDYPEHQRQKWRSFHGGLY
jgi:hypothetical protein